MPRSSGRGAAGGAEAVHFGAARSGTAGADRARSSGGTISA